MTGVILLDFSTNHLTDTDNSATNNNPKHIMINTGIN